jgi:hypothetical protein
MDFSQGANAHHAIEFGITSPLTMTLKNIDFTGFSASNNVNNSTFHVKRTSGTVTINIVDCTGVFGYRTDGATVVIAQSYSLTLTNVPSGVQVTIVNSSTRAELQNTISTGANINYTHSGGETVDILFNSLLYDPNSSDIYDLLLPSENSSIKIDMDDDLNYANPDTESPSIGTLSYSGLTGESVLLSITTATDDVGIVAFDVYNNGIFLTSLAVSDLDNTLLSGLSELTSYNLTVIARDARPNYSSVSNAISFTTLSANMISNGTFDTDTIWTKSGSMLIAGGVATTTSTPSGLSQFPTPSFVSGRTYRIVYDQTITTAGDTVVSIGAQSSGIQAGNGTKTVDIIPITSGDALIITVLTVSGFMTIDNVVVTDIT